LKTNRITGNSTAAVLQAGARPPPDEFAVLECLLTAGGRVVLAEELLERAWDEMADPFATAVKSTIRRLRTSCDEVLQFGESPRMSPP
jgi:DNA-binding response OmpR family regulator